MRLLAATGIGPGAAVVRAAPAGALYINVGQLGWAAPWMARWLRARADIRPIYMLHDVIPIEYPDLVSRIGHVTHRRMVDVAARHAAGFIFTTAAAAASVRGALCARGHTPGAALAMPLPLPSVFWHRDPEDAVLRGQVYCVIYGAIEPRKNHLLLLAVWRRLVARRGASAPRLVVIGTPARGGPPIVQALTQEPALQDHIILAAGLSSPGLRRLIAHARAVLMPSRAEGFGLPIIEALALGTPVLASDLPAHREVGESLAIYLDPDDADGWLAAIERLLDAPAPLAALRARIAGYRPLSETAYFAAVTAFLHRVGNTRGGDEPP
jgi:glycosyltransferase involved in cell wall biosynthesis